jgi:hypothetical protein
LVHFFFSLTLTLPLFHFLKENLNNGEILLNLMSLVMCGRWGRSVDVDRRWGRFYRWWWRAVKVWWWWGFHRRRWGVVIIWRRRRFHRRRR